MSQLALPLGWPADPRSDAFIVTPSNAHAAHLLDHWGTWPVKTALLTGPRKSGRSLLARIFAAKSGGAILDDADHLAETDVFHAWNQAQADRRPLVIVAAVVPPGWAVGLADLRSRLAASPSATIGAPDDALVRALLAQLFDRRGMDARPDLIDWLASRIERSHLAVIRTVDTLEQEATERRKRLSIPFARATLTGAGLLADKAPLEST